MSWSASVTTDSKTFEADLMVATKSGAPEIPEAEEQFKDAKTVVAMLIAGEAVGKNKKFQVVMHGHANPNHEPAEGWANDTITVTVNQLS